MQLRCRWYFLYMVINTSDLLELTTLTLVHKKQLMLFWFLLIDVLNRKKQKDLHETFFFSFHNSIKWKLWLSECSYMAVRLNFLGYFVALQDLFWKIFKLKNSNDTCYHVKELLFPVKVVLFWFSQTHYFIGV